MKELLADHKKYSEIDLTEEQRNKLYRAYSTAAVTNPIPGSNIKICWNDIEEADFGYLFACPEINEWEDGDLFYHIPAPSNSDGIGDVPEEFGHLNGLLSNDRIRKIIIL